MREKKYPKGIHIIELRAYIWLRAAVNCLVKKSDFRLIAAALKCAATVVLNVTKSLKVLSNNGVHTCNKLWVCPPLLLLCSNALNDHGRNDPWFPSEMK